MLLSRGEVVDLFAGPGGWDVAAKRLGLDPLGIEWDDAACATRKAAGHRTIQADVAELAPIDCWGMIASPPCQAWSIAGKRGGERDKELCVQAALNLAAGTDTRAEMRKDCEDERSMLVVEPLRWAMATRPEWIALEQVPPVLEMWTLFAQILSTHGYSVWAGVLEAERYGVPQTRERAILMADRTRTVHPPLATHQRYVFGQPARHETTFEGEILPWISMAEALGMAEGPVPTPAPTVTGGGGAHGGIEVFASKGGRARAAAGVLHTGQRSQIGGGQTEEYTRPMSEPAPTVISTARCGWRYRASTLPNAAVRAIEEPAPTVLFGQSNDVSWVQDRPATTIAGDSRVFQPGGHHEPGQQSQNAIRVTAQQAAVLQSFPADYPWQGTKTKQFEQIGNAVPPLLAEAVLRALIVTEPAMEATA